MIRVTAVDYEGGVRLDSRGHAGRPGESDEERRQSTQVCAVVSHMMLSLAIHTTAGPVTYDMDGHVACYVPGEKLHLAEYTVSSLNLLANASEGRLEVVYEGSRLFQTQETRAWTSLTIPAPPTD